MAAHLQKAAIVLPVPADEDRLHRGLHVVVNAAPAAPLEQRERPVVGVKHQPRSDVFQFSYTLAYWEPTLSQLDGLTDNRLGKPKLMIFSS